MTFGARLRPLRGAAARRAVDSCLMAMRGGSVSPRHVRDVLRCRDVEFPPFEEFLESNNAMVRMQAAEVVASCRDEKFVVSAILTEEEVPVTCRMLRELGDSGCKEVDDLTILLRHDDSMVVESAFRMFVKVGRADLLFSLAIRSDDVTTERVRRYLNEQGWLE